MLHSKEAQMQIFFHEDLAFIYNPLSLEEHISRDPPEPGRVIRSMLSGWGAQDKMNDVAEYIEDNVPREGRVLHTFALYKHKVRMDAAIGNTSENLYELI